MGFWEKIWLFLWWVFVGWWWSLMSVSQQYGNVPSVIPGAGGPGAAEVPGVRRRNLNLVSNDGGMSENHCGLKLILSTVRMYKILPRGRHLHWYLHLFHMGTGKLGQCLIQQGWEVGMILLQIHRVVRAISRAISHRKFRGFENIWGTSAE